MSKTVLIIGANGRLGRVLASSFAAEGWHVYAQVRREPVYTQARGTNTFPILRHVIAVYGNGQPAFESTLNAALAQAIANDARVR